VRDSTSTMTGLKQKIGREMKGFVVIYVYLTLLIGAFNVYRWLLLAEYHVDYLVYGYTLVEALVLAKIIIVGEGFGIGERFADRPLIIPTLYKTMLFALCVLAFSVLEHLVTGLVHGKDVAGIVREVVQSRYEMLGRILIMFVAFIPFFAFRETNRALGEVKLFDLFFRGRAAAPENPD
jgi:hypothetical protein